MMSMTDRKTVLKWAHLGLGKTGRQREIVEDERRAQEAAVKEIWQEQEQRNVTLRAQQASRDGPRLRVAAQYAAGRPKRGLHHR